MKKELKSQIIESIAVQLQETPNFYITDISGLNAKDTGKLRRACFEEQIELTVVKNTLLAHVIKEMKNDELNLILPTLVGNTAVMYTSADKASAPAKLIKKLQGGGMEKPVLKSAYVQECAYVGADKLDELAAVKSKEELIGDVISLLQSPMRNVLSALQSAGQTIAGIVKTLEEKDGE